MSARRIWNNHYSKHIHKHNEFYQLNANSERGFYKTCYGI